jgi:hypothetical protein
VHELAEVVVILNGIRAGQRKAFPPNPPQQEAPSARIAAAAAPIARPLALVDAPLSAT